MNWNQVVSSLLSTAGLVVFGLACIVCGMFGFVPHIVETPVPIGERILAFYVGIVAVVVAAVLKESSQPRQSRNLMITAGLSAVGFVILIWQFGPIMRWVGDLVANNAPAVVTGPSPIPTTAPALASSAAPSAAPATPAVPGAGAIDFTLVPRRVTIMLVSSAPSADTGPRSMAFAGPNLALKTHQIGWMFAGTVVACLDAQAKAGICSDSAAGRPFVGNRYLTAATTVADGSTAQLAIDAAVFAGSRENIRKGTHGDFLGYVLAGTRVTILGHVGVDAQLPLGLKAYQYWIQLQSP